MFKSKVVFVLGAGASQEIDLPTGEGLKEKIRSLLDFKFDDFDQRQTSGDRTIFHTIMKHAQGAYGGPLRDHTPFFLKADRLRTTLPLAISIDNLLDNFREDEQIELVGKIAIVSSILKAERESTVFTSTGTDRRSFDLSTVAKTWYGGFWKILTENASISDLNSIFENVSFVSFNYDRCIEHCVYNLLLRYYGISESEVTNLARNLVVHHPYGSIGALPWQGLSGLPQVEYGQKSVDLFESAKLIKTFTERAHEPSEIEKMRNSLQNADVIVFLGFAFHRQNLELIRPKEFCRARLVLGTAVGRSESDTDTISAELVKFFTFNQPLPKIILRRDLKCFELLNDYARSLPSAF